LWEARSTPTLTQRKMSVTGGALYVSKLTTNNSKLACIACIAIWPWL
jgi:hypothetical protein